MTKTKRRKTKTTERKGDAATACDGRETATTSTCRGRSGCLRSAGTRTKERVCVGGGRGGGKGGVRVRMLRAPSMRSCRHDPCVCTPHSVVVVVVVAGLWCFVLVSQQLAQMQTKGAHKQPTNTHEIVLEAIDCGRRARNETRDGGLREGRPGAHS